MNWLASSEILRPEADLQKKKRAKGGRRPRDTEFVGNGGCTSLGLNFLFPNANVYTQNIYKCLFLFKKFHSLLFHMSILLNCLISSCSYFTFVPFLFLTNFRSENNLSSLFYCWLFPNHNAPITILGYRMNEI